MTPLTPIDEQATQERFEPFTSRNCSVCGTHVPEGEAYNASWTWDDETDIEGFQPMCKACDESHRAGHEKPEVSNEEQ